MASIRVIDPIRIGQPIAVGPEVTGIKVGPVGPQGPQGLKGDKGDTGERGEPGGWNSAASLSTSTSLNTVVAPGTYYRGQPAVAPADADDPIPVFTGVVEVFRYFSDAYIVQRAHRVDTYGPISFIRQRQNGTWHPWRQIAYKSPGQPGGGDLTGVGMPNGAVTAIPGVYYTDTAGTNGAWRWLKTSGTGSTGWKVVVGDTGWRDTYRWDSAGAMSVGDELPAGWTKQGSHGAISFRRINDTVYIALRGLLTTQATQQVPIPPYFSAGSAPWPTVILSGDIGGAPSITRHLVGAGMVYCAFATNTRVTNSGGDYAAYAWWLTTSTWPISLPGAPA